MIRALVTGSLAARCCDEIVGRHDPWADADWTLVDKTTNIVLWTCFQQNGPPPVGAPLTPARSLLRAGPPLRNSPT